MLLQHKPSRQPVGLSMARRSCWQRDFAISSLQNFLGHFFDEMAAWDSFNASVIGVHQRLVVTRMDRYGYLIVPACTGLYKHERAESSITMYVSNSLSMIKDGSRAWQGRPKKVELSWGKLLEYRAFEREWSAVSILKQIENWGCSHGRIYEAEKA